jgi:hypothetical protein
MFHAGMIGVIGVFLLYLVKESAFRDWVKQSFTIISFYATFFGGKDKIIYQFLTDLIFPFFPLSDRTLGSLDGRLLLYSLIFFYSLVIFSKIGFKKVLGKLKGLQQQFSEREKLLFLFSSVTLFGYIQSLHSYSVVRLQSASSLGLGLLILLLDNLSKRFKRSKLVVFTVPIVCLFIYLSQTLVFKHTPSVDFPWNQKLLLSHQLKEPENIEMLQGKLYDEKTRIFYQTLAKTMSNYNCQLDYLVSFSKDSYIPRLSKSFKRVQRSPFYSRQLSELIFQDEQEKISQLLTQGKAILILTPAQIQQVPENYRVVLEAKIAKGIPYIDKIRYVAVPKSVSSICPVTQVR